MDDVLSNLMGPLSPHNSVQAAAVALQNDFENLIIENKKYYAMACKGESFVCLFIVTNESNDEGLFYPAIYRFVYTHLHRTRINHPPVIVIPINPRQECNEEYNERPIRAAN